MKIIVLTTMVVIVVAMSGCTGTMVKTYVAAGSQPLCDASKGNLGYVAVLPEAAWRNDQKEPAERQSMAMQAIRDAFASMPCGNLSPPGGIRTFSAWADVPESKLIARAAAEGINILLLLRIEELTPNLYITFSLPILWLGSNEVDFRIRAIAVQTGTVIADLRMKRTTGGPFNLRPAAWSEEELCAALKDILSHQEK